MFRVIYELRQLVVAPKGDLEQMLDREHPVRVCPSKLMKSASVSTNYRTIYFPDIFSVTCCC